MAHQINGFPHSIGIIKRVFGFQQVTHRRLAKNLHRLEVSAVGTQIAQSIGDVSMQSEETASVRGSSIRSASKSPSARSFPRFVGSRCPFIARFSEFP